MHIYHLYTIYLFYIFVYPYLIYHLFLYNLSYKTTEGFKEKFHAIRETAKTHTIELHIHEKLN